MSWWQIGSGFGEQIIAECRGDTNPDVRLFIVPSRRVRVAFLGADAFRADAEALKHSIFCGLKKVGWLTFSLFLDGERWYKLNLSDGSWQRITVIGPLATDQSLKLTDPQAPPEKSFYRVFRTNP